MILLFLNLARPIFIAWQASEAIRIGAQAIRKHKISIEQVHLCLEELSETVASQKQVDEALGDCLPSLWDPCSPSPSEPLQSSFPFTRLLMPSCLAGLALLDSTDAEDEYLEEDFRKLELELTGEAAQVTNDAVAVGECAPDEATLVQESAGSLADTFSHLHLTAA